MRLDDHSLEPVEMTGDLAVVFGRNRARIEETAGVVELDSTRRRKGGQRTANLRGDRASGNGLLRRVPPEIAHQAAPGALPVGEQDRGNGNDVAAFGRFLFHEHPDRPRRIDGRTRWTT